MNPNDITDADLVTLPSAHSATETVERLQSLLSQKKIQMFADIDHAAAAKRVGLSLRPTRVLIFGNPQAAQAQIAAMARPKPSAGRSLCSCRRAACPSAGAYRRLIWR